MQSLHAEYRYNAKGPHDFQAIKPKETGNFSALLNQSTMREVNLVFGACFAVFKVIRNWPTTIHEREGEIMKANKAYRNKIQYPSGYFFCVDI